MNPTERLLKQEFRNNQTQEEYFTSLEKFNEKELLIEICRLLYDIKNQANDVY